MRPPPVVLAAAMREYLRRSGRVVHKRRRVDRPALLRRKSSHGECGVRRRAELTRRERMIMMKTRRKSETSSDFMYTRQQTSPGVPLGESRAHPHARNSER